MTTSNRWLWDYGYGLKGERAVFPIIGLDFKEARQRYYGIIKGISPTFESFLSPAGYSMFPNDPDDNQWLWLSPTGEQRWAIMQSPHAEALVKAWLCRQD